MLTLGLSLRPKGTNCATTLGDSTVGIKGGEICTLIAPNTPKERTKGEGEFRVISKRVVKKGQ